MFRRAPQRSRVLLATAVSSAAAVLGIRLIYDSQPMLGSALIVAGLAVALIGLGLAAKGEALLGAGVALVGGACMLTSLAIGPADDLVGGLGLLILGGSILLIGVAITVDGKALDTFAAVVIGGAALVIGVQAIARAVEEADSGSIFAGMVGTTLGIAIIGLGATGVLTRFRSGEAKLQMSAPKSARPQASTHQQAPTLVRPLAAPALNRATRERTNELRALLDDRDATITSNQEMITKLARQQTDREVHAAADKEMISQLTATSEALRDELSIANKARAQAETAASEAQLAVERTRDTSAEVKRLTKDLTAAHRQIDQMEVKQRKAANEAEQLRINVTELAALAESRDQLLRDRSEALAAGEKRIENLNRQSNDAKVVIATLEAECADREAKAREASERLAGAKEAETRLAGKADDLAQQLGDLTAERDALAQRVESLTQELAAARSEAATIVDQARAEADEAVKQVQQKAAVTVETAQTEANAAVRAARRESENVRKTTRSEADAAVQQAHREAKAAVEQAQSEAAVAVKQAQSEAEAAVQQARTKAEAAVEQAESAVQQAKSEADLAVKTACGEASAAQTAAAEAELKLAERADEAQALHAVVARLQTRITTAERQKSEAATEATTNKEQLALSAARVVEAENELAEQVAVSRREQERAVGLREDLADAERGQAQLVARLVEREADLNRALHQRELALATADRLRDLATNRQLATQRLEDELRAASATNADLAAKSLAVDDDLSDALNRAEIARQDAAEARSAAEDQRDKIDRLSTQLAHATAQLDASEADAAAVARQLADSAKIAEASEAAVEDFRTLAATRADLLNRQQADLLQQRTAIDSLTAELAKATGYRSELEVLTAQFFEATEELTRIKDLARRYAVRVEELESEAVKNQLELDERVRVAFESASSLGERAAVESEAKTKRIAQLESQLEAYGHH